MIYLFAGVYAIVAGNVASYTCFIYHREGIPLWLALPAALLMALFWPIALVYSLVKGEMP